MLKALLTLLAGGIVVHCENNHYYDCEGTYKIDDVRECDDPEQYKYDLSITKRMINSTHDGYTLTCDLPEKLSQDFGMAANIYSKYDDRYKLTDSYNLPSLCGPMNQNVKDEFKHILAVGGYDAPNCPIPRMMDYVVDNRKLPRQNKCGLFKNEVFVLDGETKVACIIAYVTISPVEHYED